MEKRFVVFSKRLAKTLIAQGFVLVDKKVNNKRPNYFIYLFEDRQELREAINKITKKTPQNYSEHN